MIDYDKKVMAIDRSGIIITEKKINIEPDPTLQIIGVQGKIFGMYSSQTDKTFFYNIDIMGQLEASFI